MRHVRSILYALVLAPAIWVLCGVGFTGDLIGRARENTGTIETLTGLLMLVLAGAAYAILIFSPISPAGPLLGGLVYLGIGLWSWATPASYASAWSPELSKDGFNLSLPGYGLALLLSVPMICTALSARRWARYEPPVLPLIGTLGRAHGTATVAGEPMAAAQTTIFRTPPAEATQVLARPAEVSTLLVAPGAPDQEATSLLVVPADPGSTTVIKSPPADEATTLLKPPPGDDGDEATTLLKLPVSDATAVLDQAATGSADEATALLREPEAEGDQATTLLPSAAAVLEALAQARAEADDDGEEKTQLIRLADADKTEDVRGERATEAVPIDQPTVDVRGEQATEDVRGEQATESVATDQPTADVHGEQATADVHGEQATADVHGEQATEDIRGEQVTEAVQIDQPTPDLPGELVTEAVPIDQPTADVHGEDATEAVPIDQPTADVRGEQATEAVQIAAPVLVSREEPTTADVWAGDGPGDKTVAIQLVGERATADLGRRTREFGPGEKTVVIARDPGEQTQVIRMPSAVYPPPGETTRDVRKTTGTVEPPGERTQVIHLPAPAEEPATQSSIVSAERPDPGADPTTRLMPIPVPAETTVEQKPATKTVDRPMTVMNMERPPDEAQDDTRPLTVPTQRRSPED